ncbi:TPM domain-containing protein [Archangium lansingense]|uniref:TPM domain-containing protein n=1 Tax=Archangium lansingense TaxID=2995310 RepID=UPI003B7F670F
MRALLCWTLLFCALSLPAQGETVRAIPRPRPGSWSVDTTGTLSSPTLAQVDQWGSEVDGKGLGQLAVVVVVTTGGRNPRTFATELFNLWGIGHAGRDDGALLLIALRDRKAEIVLGDGVDSRADTARSDALMSGQIVPAFKRGDPGGAVLAGARGLRDLLERSPLNAAVSRAAPPLSASSTPSTAVSSTSANVPSSGAAPVQEPPPFRRPPSSYESPPVRGGSNDMSVWFYGGGTGALVAGFAGLRRWLRRRPRICERCAQPRQLLDEDRDDAHLDGGQQREERLGSVDYDVWWCLSCHDARVERYGAWLTSYSKCPQCEYKTKSETSTTLEPATYDHGGRVLVEVSCEHCSYRNSFTRSTPKLTRPSSSSSSRGGSSFGGGRSSGGGSSGSW